MEDVSCCCNFLRVGEGRFKNEQPSVEHVNTPKHFTFIQDVDFVVQDFIQEVAQPVCRKPLRVCCAISIVISPLGHSGNSEHVAAVIIARVDAAALVSLETLADVVGALGCSVTLDGDGDDDTERGVKEVARSVGTVSESFMIPTDRDV